MNTDPLHRALRAALLALVACLLGPLATTAGAAGDTVTISGRAYAFNHMDTYLQGATIRIRELPELSATTDANGDYSLEVPDQTTVTPYIEPPDGYNQIDLQTFHTRGGDIRNANFQTPADLEYGGLAALLAVPIGPDGRPTDCVIVTTASARNVRGVSYETFHARTPHGVPGATSTESPPLEGPTYFNESVIPDPSKTATSEDGGIVWTEVPAGTYRISTSSPTARFASFLATCAPGRIVNANPPWGAYQLADGEGPLGASMTAASAVHPYFSGVSDGTSFKNRKLGFTIRAGEAVDVSAVLFKKNESVGSKAAKVSAAGDHTVRVPMSKSVRRGKARLEVTLTDAAGESVTNVVPVKIPRRQQN